MSIIQYAKRKLERDWRNDVKGRVASIPEPYIAFENEDTEEKLRYKDVIKIQDGGVQEINPFDLHHESERVISLVQLDIRTVDKNRPQYNQAIGSPGRVRMFGYRDSQTLESEASGGLTGEAKRVFQEDRRGDVEFTLIQSPEINDISNQTGQGHYRAMVTLRFDSMGSDINA